MYTHIYKVQEHEGQNGQTTTYPGSYYFILFQPLQGSYEFTHASVKLGEHSSLFFQKENDEQSHGVDEIVSMPTMDSRSGTNQSLVT
jgi:hypothetical protein